MLCRNCGVDKESTLASIKVLLKEHNDFRKQVEQLEAELETERMRLAACGVVALANTRGSASIARDMLPQYRNKSYKEVEKAVDREMALQDHIKQLEADREKLLQLLESASEVIGRFVSDEGWAQSDMDTMDTIDAEIVRMRRAAQ